MSFQKHDLIGKTALNREGIMIGTIKDAVIDELTGKTLSLLISPAKEIDITLFQHNKEGDIIFPCIGVSAVRNAVILDQ
jgi:sporulation protein YlmC with PRC-barrel domain